MNRVFLFLALVLAVVAAACDDAMPSANNAADSTNITATIWRLESIERNGQTQHLDDNTVISLQFDASTLGGIGPCNRYTGAYTVDGAAMSISQFTSTDATCAEADLEEGYFTDLRNVGGYLATASTLKLYASGGSVVLTYVKVTSLPVPRDTIPPNVEPRGRSWKLVKIEAGGAIDTLDAAPWVTLALRTDAKASGAGPCSEYSAAYTIDSVAIAFRELQNSGKVCPRSERERTYFAALRDARTYRSTAESLRIMFEGGVLHYVPYVPPVDTVPNAPVRGREWRLRVLADAIDTIEHDGVQAISLRFGLQNDFAGLGTCSRYQGLYSIDGRRITIETLNDGGINCGARALEDRYFRLLRSAMRFESTDSTLRIFTSNGGMLFYEVARPNANRLVGTEWRLERMAMRGAGEIIPNGLIDLKFGADQLEGMGLCNRYESDYLITAPDRIELSNFSSTEIACPELQFEDKYFAALIAAAEFKLSPERLMIFAPSATLFFRPL